MSTFTSRTNIVTGNQEWVFIDNEDFDYQQELARSAFADMLHDHERNVQYEKAIEKTIENLSKTNKTIHVLDIGTGTGLLSMISARALNRISNSSLSSHITACEVFQPMAKIAKKCIGKNHLSDRIQVIDKRSTELDLDKDLQGNRINMIVAEVFDTELIGEGALRTFSEACQHLTIDKDNLRIIPARATIYIQLVQSSTLLDFHRLKNLSNQQRIILPDECRHLAGNTIFDLNINELKDFIRPLSDPIPVFHFDFKSLDTSKNFIEEKLLENIQCHSSGQIDAFIMWWNLDMDEEGEIQLGTIPIWCLNDSEQKANIQWREHWIHGIFYPQQSKIVQTNEQLSLYCYHDEYSLYFDIGNQTYPSRSFPPTFLSRLALAGFNNEQRRKKYLQGLEQLFSNSSIQHCLYVGDGLLLPLLILEYYPHIQLNILQSNNTHLTRILEGILSNSTTKLNYRMISSLENEENFQYHTIDAIISEPFFTKSVLPWDNLHFYYLIEQYRLKFRSDIKIFPSKARIRCIALEFDNLHKIRSPVGQCCQFDLTPFDEEILSASYQVDATIEPQSLFEYSSKKPTLSSIIDLFPINFQQTSLENKIEQFNLDISIKENGICNGLAFWIDYQLDENNWLTTGIEYENDSWVNYSKQGVHLLRKPIHVEQGMKINVTTGFDFKQGQFIFDIISKK